MERINCFDCCYMDNRQVCRLYPVIPNQKIHILEPKIEWCGQAVRNNIEVKQVETIEEVKQIEESQSEPIRRGRPKK